MPIRFLEDTETQPQVKSKIRFLDDQPAQMSQRDLFKQELEKPEQQPEWYDVPGKIANTLQKTNEKIDREVDLRNSGKQSTAQAMGWGVLHGLGATGGVLGDVFSPLIDNPISKGIIEGAAHVGSSGNINKANKLQPQIPESNVDNKFGKAVLDYTKQNPEVLNRIGSTFDVVTTYPIAKAVKGGVSYLGDVLKNSSKMQMAKGELKQFASRAATPLMNQTGAVEIPDIDDLAKALDGPVAEGAKSSKQIKKDVGRGPKRGFSQSDFENYELTALSTPKSENVEPFTNYAEQAIKASRDRTQLTPADLAGKKAASALNAISLERNKWGKIKDDIISKNESTPFSISDVRSKWDDYLVDRLGVQIKDGELIDAQGRFARRPSEFSQIKQIDDLLNKTTTRTESVGYDLFTREMDDLKSALNDIVQAPKASQVKQINTVTEGIGKELVDMIDKKLSDALGPDFGIANKNYSRIKKIEDQLNKRLGEVVDPETGTVRHGASLMKSAVQSNADRGTKALFQAVKDITGYDLMQDALYAEIAMKGVNDPRMNSLLEAAGVAMKLGKGNVGVLADLGKKAIDKLKGEKIYNLVNYYNKNQPQIKINEDLGKRKFGR